MFSRKDVKKIVNSGRRNSYVPDVTIDKINIFFSSRGENKTKFIESKRTRNKYGSLVYEFNVKPSDFKLDKTLVANLDLSIRDVDKGTWFGNEIERKYLKIKVVQSNSLEVTRKIINGSLRLYPGKLDHIPAIKEVTLSTSKRGSLSDYYHYASGNGTIYKIPYRASFTVEDYEHIYYFAVCYMDVEAMLSDQFLSKRPRNPLRYRGRLAAEPLMVDGKKVFNRAAMIHPDGFVWQGSPGLGQAGGTEGLTKINVGNNKIHDYTLFQSLRRSIRFASANGRSTRPYFSKAHMSRDKNNACRFIFRFDYLSAIRDNIKFGGLAKSMPASYKSAHIKSVKIFRERTRQENYSSTKGTHGSKELICYSSDTRAGVLQKIFNEADLNKDGQNDAYIGTISEINLKNSDRVRSFMVFDNSMSFVDDGKYQYSVEILMEDPTEKILLRKLRKIRRIKKDMLGYYRIASKPGKFLHESNRFSPSFVEAIKKQQGIPSILEISDTQDASLIRSSVWNSSVRDFLYILRTLTNKRFQDYYKRLSYMVRPSTGTARGIGEFIKLIELTEDYLSKALSGNEPGGESSSHNRTDLKKAHGSLNRGAIKLNYTFREVFNASIVKNLGYDYWGGSARSSRSGLTFLTKRSLKKRLGQNAGRSLNSLVPAEIRYSVGKVNMLSGKNLDERAVMVNAVISGISREAGSRSHSLPPVGARRGGGWDIGVTPPADTIPDGGGEDFDILLDAEFDIYEEGADIAEVDEEIPVEEILSEGDKFLTEDSDAKNIYRPMGSKKTDVEKQSIRDLSASLLADSGVDYFNNLRVAVEYFKGDGTAGISDDKWALVDGAALSDDGDDGALLVRLRGSTAGVETGQLDMGEVGAYDEVVVVMAGGSTRGGEGPDELQNVDYGGGQISYDEREEAAPDPDFKSIEQKTIYPIEEAYLEDQNSLDGAYILPSKIGSPRTQGQAEGTRARRPGAIPAADTIY